MNDFNLIEATDSYKVSHYLQYPHGTETVLSYFESRGGAFSDVTFFGLQYILKRYLVGQVVTRENLDEAIDDFAAHFANASLMNVAGWERIIDVHQGCLPVEIKAVPEGTTVPTGNVLMTIENTDPELPWLTNYLETLLSQVWYPTTVCTQSREMKKIYLRYLEATGDPSLVDFKMHDFGFRGSTSVESAGIGGAAHLVNFLGTDTVQALRLARKYYNERMAGYSIPAAEHSTITSWGRENETAACANMLTSYPTGLVAVVSDSYDIYNACRNIWGKELREQVLQRDGVLVVRPDSGNPLEVVIRVLNLLGEAFGTEVNAKGYKILNPKVRVIQGDGIDIRMEDALLEELKNKGWSADNLTMGSGGGLLQKVNRDTLKFAIKCCSVTRDGQQQDVSKDPITGSGKKSKAGRLVLVRQDGLYRTIRQEEAERQGLKNELVTVFRDGELLIDQSLADIRNRARIA